MTDSSDTPDRTDRSGRADKTSGGAADTTPESAIPPGMDPAASETPTPRSDAAGPSDAGAPPRKVLVTAVVLAVALVAGVGALGLFGQDADSGPGNGSQADAEATGPAGPLPLVSIPAPEADSDACRRMLEAAPDHLTSSGERLERRELAQPAPSATAAWGRDNPVVLRCGLDRPPELKRTSTLRQINGVQWLHVPDKTSPSATWYVVDRPAYLALTVPEGTGTGPLQRISDLADENLKQVSPTF